MAPRSSSSIAFHASTSQNEKCSVATLRTPSSETLTSLTAVSFACGVSPYATRGAGCPSASSTFFHGGPYKTVADVEYATAGWVDWYNNRRLHGTLGNVPPVGYDKPTTDLNREPHPV
jgi:transposase InsO family protein